jgi:hypothetical protein
MGKFSLDAKDHTTSTSLLTACSIVYAAGEAGEIVEMMMTGSGVTAAADTQHDARGAHSTNAGAGTSTAQTANQFDDRSAASTATGAVLFTAQPTSIDTVHDVSFGFNQRGGMRWAVPRGEGVKVNGDDAKLAYRWQVISSAAGKVNGNIHWWEP